MLKKEIIINDISYIFDYEENSKLKDINMEFVSDSDGVALYKVVFKWEESVIPSPIQITYQIDCIDCYSLWDCLNKERHINAYWVKNRTVSRLANGMPIKQVISKQGLNRHLVAISDAKNPISISMGGNQDLNTVETEIKFFTAITSPMNEYEAYIRVDAREIIYSNAIRSARDWYNSFGYIPPYVPADAKQPVYSTWYSYRQNIFAKQLIKECKYAVKDGMKVIIVDDGWQTDNETHDYEFVGDWKPSRKKFYDMKNFVEKVHDVGMKVMLWYCVPLVGFHSKVYKRFEGKYLYNMDHLKCSVIDPRYKEVRDWLISIYTTAVKEWGLDGLKLDFIDCFYSNGKVEDGMDFVSVEDATECLLRDVNTALKEINPEILIEFRQSYIGPVVTSYGNMIRVVDCPNDQFSNKKNGMDLRLTSSTCAVHSDMIRWNLLDTPESVAVQLFSSLFLIPQISVVYEELPDVHRNVLKRFMSFWTEHKDTLINGKLTASNPELLYTSITAESENERISVLYSDSVIEATRKQNYFINLSQSVNLIIKSKRDKYFVEVFDCMGGRVSRKSRIKSDLAEIYVPMGGMAVVEEV
ncbi:MAG: alpha-galactosidase [Clostridiales bacterium]|nr:alpha-galactosidase [Clostridiales bacterium]